MPQFTLPERPQKYALTVPEHWVTFDTTSHAQLVNAKREAMAKATSAKERIAIDDLFDHAKKVTRTARKSGALWGAGTATSYDDGLFVGHVMLFAIRSADPTSYSPAQLTVALGSDRLKEGTGELPPRKITSIELTDELLATRVTGREIVQVDDSRSVPVVVSHTFVPVPGQEGEFLLITGLSPNLSLETAVLDLFDAIAGTFRYL